ncbi:MAG: hypothetical protein QRY72_01415 [Candidatus Rhabdochlamydia sp.]
MDLTAFPPYFQFYGFKLCHQGFADKLGFLLESSDGRFAEIAPLETRNKESLRDVYHQLKALQQGWKGALLPSVAFGLYSLTAPRVKDIRCALLLHGTPEEVLALASTYGSFEVAKLKIGDYSLDEAIATVLELSKTLKLRLDFNDKWSLSHFKMFCDKIQGASIEFLEDPPAFTPLFPIAADQKIKRSHIHVHKPMVKGLPSHQAPVILSSSFEGSLGLEAIASLTLSYGIPDHVLGLGTAIYLEEDLYLQSATLREGKIIFPSSYQLNTQKLFSPDHFLLGSC